MSAITRFSVQTLRYAQLLEAEGLTQKGQGEDDLDSALGLAEEEQEA